MLTFEGFCWLLLLFAFVAVRYPCFAYVMQEGRKEGGKEGRKGREGKKAARKEGRKEGEHLQVASLQSCAACSGQCREHCAAAGGQLEGRRPQQDQKKNPKKNGKKSFKKKRGPSRLEAIRMESEKSQKSLG